MTSKSKHTGPHDGCHIEGLHEHPVASVGRIQILSVRHPDASTVTRVFLDGKEIEDYDETDVDPGAGYEAEDYRERLDDLNAIVAQPDATDYDRACLAALQDMRGQFRKYAYMGGDEWDAIVDAPEEVNEG